MFSRLNQILKFIWNHPIGRKKPIKSCSRFLFFQLGSLFNSKGRVYSFVNDALLEVKKGQHGLTGNVYVGLLEFEDMSFLLHFLRSDDNFADVGSNLGAYTILASKVCGSRSWAFEPVPSSYSGLVRNVELNEIGNLVEAFNIGIGDRKGKLRITTEFDTINHILANDDSGVKSVDVDVETLDNVFNLPVNLIKLDVEGYELPVLNGAKRIIQMPDLKALIVELNSSGGRYGIDDNVVHQFLLDYNFKPYGYNPFERSLIALNGFNRSNNTIYIRDLNFVKERLSTAKEFQVMGLNI